ncbi:mCG141278 [Mus musculus]|nr:mCG141278 [Mus musculus]
MEGKERCITPTLLGQEEHRGPGNPGTKAWWKTLMMLVFKNPALWRMEARACNPSNHVDDAEGS